MKHKITSAATLWLLLSAASVHAADMPDQYTLYCKGEKATGFDWQSNDWVAMNFKPQDYIVIKSPNNKCSNVNEKIKEIPKLVPTKEVCVNIREAGTDYIAFLSRNCTEYYPNSLFPNTQPFLSCKHSLNESFATNFNGWFQRSHFHSVVASEIATKESLVIEVGKCSQIN